MVFHPAPPRRNPKHSGVRGNPVRPRDGTGRDVWTIAGEGGAPRHTLVRVAAGRIEVEDLAGGTLANGHPITGRIEAEYPASVQVGELTLVAEQKDNLPFGTSQNPRPLVQARISFTTSP